MDIQVKTNHNDKHGEFMLLVNGVASGNMTFVFMGKNVISVNHTGIDEAFKGLGYGRYLMEEMVKFSRENGLKVIPVCPYVVKMMDRTPDYQDVLYVK